MISFQQESFTAVGFRNVPNELLNRLDRLFGRLFDVSGFIALEVRDFVDASTSAQSRFLPDGVKNPDKDYFYVKTDSSANAVTIYSVTGQTINGAGSYALAAQYNRVTLVWNFKTQNWIIKCT